MAEVQSLARGLRILDLLAQSDGGIGVSDIAQHLGVDKSSAWRLMQTLVSYGYATQDTRTKRYRTGSHIVALSYALLRDMPLRDQAKDFLYDLVNRTGECAHLAVFLQGQALVIDDIQTTATLRVITGVGRLSPLHCSAVGKSLLAFGKFPFPTDLEKYTARTITDPEMLQLDLQQTREQGFAVDDEELTIGVRCIAAPVFDFSGELLGSIGVSGPSVRVSHERLEELAEIVTRVAQELSNNLGYSRQPVQATEIQR